MKKNYIILMVEDEEGVMDVNRRMLKRRGYDLKEAKNAKEAYTFLEKEIPDLLILDIMLPDGDGYEICREFRKKSDNPVIFLTGKNQIKDKVKGLEEGGDYYLTKPYNFEEFLAVIKRLLARTDSDLHIKENEVVIGKLKFDLTGLFVTIGDEHINLTNKEAALLKIFAENRNRELSAEKLYNLAWGQSSGGDVRAVRKHIMNLRNKIKADDSEDYDIVTSYGKGYTFVTYGD